MLSIDIDPINMTVWEILLVACLKFQDLNAQLYDYQILLSRFLRLLLSINFTFQIIKIKMIIIALIEIHHLKNIRKEMKAIFVCVSSKQMSFLEFARKKILEAWSILRKILRRFLFKNQIFVHLITVPSWTESHYFAQAS